MKKKGDFSRIATKPGDFQVILPLLEDRNEMIGVSIWQAEIKK